MHHNGFLLSLWQVPLLLRFNRSRPHEEHNPKIAPGPTSPKLTPITVGRRSSPIIVCRRTPVHVDPSSSNLPKARPEERAGIRRWPVEEERSTSATVTILPYRATAVRTCTTSLNSLNLWVTSTLFNTATVRGWGPKPENRPCPPPNNPRWTASSRPATRLALWSR